MCSAIHGNTLLGPLFLEGEVQAEWYLQLLSGVWELRVDEMPLVVRWFDFLQDGASPHLAGGLRKLTEEVYHRR